MVMNLEDVVVASAGALRRCVKNVIEMERGERK
jgi:hypothetical protein